MTADYFRSFYVRLWVERGRGFCYNVVLSMKKAVIQSGGKQYLVEEGQVLDVELLDRKDGDKVEFPVLAVVDGEKSEFGVPELKNKVSAEVVSGDYQGTKVVSIRFKAKKRVNKKQGHRQHYSKVRILKIG